MDLKFDIEELLEKENKTGYKFDYIRFTVADLNGIGRSQLVPRRHAEDVLKNGYAGFAGIMAVSPRTDLTCTKEIMECHIPNAMFFPCPKTLHEVPWAGRKKTYSKEDQRQIGQVLCETSWMPPYRNGSPQEACSRYALRKQLEILGKMGYTFKSAFEAEFSVHHRQTRKPVFEDMDALSTLRLSEFEDYLCTLEENFYKAGIDVSSIIVEHGEGQFEFAMEPVDGIKGADTMFMIKNAIKEISQERGLTATFMSKPCENSSTTGLHLNMSLWTTGPEDKLKNAFYDPSDKDGLSQLHRYWIAGLIKHGKALSAFCCPTFNCYRRLHGFLAPSKIDWGIDDRLAAFRAKSFSPSATYVENRLPSGSCNPYLATACTIAAGLDGVINKLQLPEPRKEGLDLNSATSPVDVQIDTEKVKYFPYSLKDALDALEKDEQIKDALGEELVRWFVQTKREKEVEVLEPLEETAKWEKEIELYFEFL